MGYKTTEIVNARTNKPMPGWFVPTSEELLAVVRTEEGTYSVVMPTLGIAANARKRFSSQAKAMKYGRRILSVVKPMEIAMLGDDMYNMPMAMARSVAKRVKALN